MTACDSCGDTLPHGTGVPVINHNGVDTGTRLCHLCIAGDPICQWGDCTKVQELDRYCQAHYRQERNRLIMGRAGWLGWD